MTRSKLPRVFRISAALVTAAVVFGGWWQVQPAGTRGRTFLAVVAHACPAAAARHARPTVADTAHALDRLAYLSAMDALRGGPSRCASGAAR